jgi:hypothetical protein
MQQRRNFHVWIEGVGWDTDMTPEELAANTTDDIRLFVLPKYAEEVLDELRAAAPGKLGAQVVSTRVRLTGEVERYAVGLAIEIWDFEKSEALYLRKDGQFRAYEKREVASAHG